MKKYCYGLYGYWDKKKQKFIYIGIDSHINKKARHKDHLKPSHYNLQKINQILQKDNNNRYQYKILYYDLLNKEIMYDLEKKQIALLKPKFNYSDGGEGNPGLIHSEETKKKISQANSGKKNGMFGKPSWNKGVSPSKETKEKLSQINKGKNNPFFGKKHSQETIEYLRKINTGKNHPKYIHLSDETISIILKEYQNKTPIYKIAKKIQHSSGLVRRVLKEHNKL